MTEQARRIAEGRLDRLAEALIEETLAMSDEEILADVGKSAEEVEQLLAENPAATEDQAVAILTSAARAAVARLSPPTDVEILREALEPFAVFALEGKRGGKFIICKGLFEDMKNWDDSPPRSAHLHIDDFLRARKARAALSGHGK
ncbi:MAG TPA: hypothetical protein VFS91_01460 [Nitrobacter sp.]|nr:hypothetical protein [Nitrobacter sp.]